MVYTTHRVAIANSRLNNWNGDQVEFTYKDYQANGKQKNCHLSTEAFIRRFLWHVLPEGFQKIRYFGFWASAHYKKNLENIRRLIQPFQKALPPLQQMISDLSKVLLPPIIFTCPVCHQGEMRFCGIVNITLNHWTNQTV